MSIFDGVRRFMDQPLDVPPMEIPLMVTFPSVKDRKHRSEKKSQEEYQTDQIKFLMKAQARSTTRAGATVPVASVVNRPRPPVKPEVPFVMPDAKSRVTCALLSPVWLIMILLGGILGGLFEFIACVAGDGVFLVCRLLFAIFKTCSALSAQNGNHLIHDGESE